MVEEKSMDLVYRLSSCLEAILDLERDIARLDLGEMLHGELEFLKNYLRKVDTFNILEEDVARIEAATANFLDELREPLASMRDGKRGSRVLQ